jgi:hypothetical protein
MTVLLNRVVAELLLNSCLSACFFPEDLGYYLSQSFRALVQLSNLLSPPGRAK